MGQIVIPLTGSGDATANVAVDEIGGAAYQRVKLFDGAEGSTLPIIAKSSSPNASDPGMLVRLVGASTSFSVANPSTAVTITNPTTAVTVSNPTTAVSVSSGLVLGGSTQMIGLTGDVPMSRVRTTLNTSVDTTALAANAARKAAMIQNGSTAATLLVNLSSAVVTSASYDFQIPINDFVVIGGVGGRVPLYTGNIHVKMNSTALAGPAFVSEFT